MNYSVVGQKFNVDQQCLLNKVPLQYGTGTEREVYTNGTRQKAQKQTHTPMATLSLTKEARIYNGLKTISLTSGPWKTGQPLVKE